MAFQGKIPIRSNICTYNKFIDQVECFKYLGYYIT
jgi:hypothetical protein